MVTFHGVLGVIMDASLVCMYYLFSFSPDSSSPFRISAISIGLRLDWTRRFKQQVDQGHGRIGKYRNRYGMTGEASFPIGY